MLLLLMWGNGLQYGLCENLRHVLLNLFSIIDV